MITKFVTFPEFIFISEVYIEMTPEVHEALHRFLYRILIASGNSKYFRFTEGRKVHIGVGELTEKARKW